MKKILLFLLAVTFLASCSPYKKYANTAAGWEEEIFNLEFKDDAETYSDDAILFVGSSSIRYWDNIKADMAPYEPIRRGYGGAHFTDLIHFTKRLVYPHEFRALCLFIANDITGGENDKSISEVVRLYKEVVNTVRLKYPSVPIFYIAITPTSSRWKAWSEINELNETFQAYCGKTENMYYIDTVSPYLDDEGMPRDELFVEDKLHQNQAGYDIWARLIKAELDKVL